MTSGEPRRGIGRRLLRSGLAVLAGLTGAILIEVVGIYGLVILEATAIASGTSSILLFLGYLVLAGIVGGFVAARLARRRPVTHAGILGILWWLVVAPDALKASVILPGWRLAGFVLIPLPGALLGGMLSARRTRKGES